MVGGSPWLVAICFRSWVLVIICVDGRSRDWMTLVHLSLWAVMGCHWRWLSLTALLEVVWHGIATSLLWGIDSGRSGGWMMVVVCHIADGDVAPGCPSFVIIHLFLVATSPTATWPP